MIFSIMNNKMLPWISVFTFVLLLGSGSACAQRGVRIAYIDVEYILENVEEYRQANEQLNIKAAKWKEEVELMRSEIEEKKKDLRSERVLLTNELIEEREEEIRLLETKMIQYQQDRFGPEGDLVLQKRLLVQPIQDMVFAEVQKIGENRRYDFIFDRSADVVMLFADKRHDLSDMVLREIGRTKKISESRREQKEKERMEQLREEGIVPPEEVNEELKARQDAVSKLREDRLKEQEERRAEQLRLREERRKAYEERRKKLLEEREKRRLEKLREREGNSQDSIPETIKKDSIPKVPENQKL